MNSPVATAPLHRSLSFPQRAGPQHLPAALDFVRETLAEWHLPPASEAESTTAHDAVLVTAELVTNAIEHAAGPRCLDLDHRHGLLRITVTDRSTARPVPYRHHGASRTGGRGLHIIGALTDHWGTMPLPGGKTVWAEIPVTGPRGAAGGSGRPPPS
ncbi:ATP-binding protein [Kitasatospora sp. NBC_01539]|uniref:ATP-binding protein n=1 Tax=Kitasatospora sp. NBC_01539 TaxID=2903577 RepID=UPI00386011C0